MQTAHPRPARLVLAGAAALLLTLTGCTSSRSGAGGEVSPERIARLEQRFAADSTNREVRRDLGIAYLRGRRFSEAAPLLRRAHQMSPSDPMARFYYGLNLEALGDSADALRLYEAYPQVPSSSRYRKLLQGRHRLVMRGLAEAEIRRRIAGEDTLTAAPGTIAVFPFEYAGADVRFAALGRGLGEMILVDLSQIDQLRTVERIRLQALLDELALARTGAFEAESAPRSGLLLGAENVVSGSYNIIGENLNVDVAAWRGAALPGGLNSHADAVTNLFALEKDIVFSLLEDFRINLSPAEREAIERVPTRNLQAFLAYSRGLMEEDAGQYATALEFYNQALSLDPGFTLATDQAEILQSVLETQGSPVEVATRTGGGSRAPRDDVADRHQALGDNIGSLTLPGQEGRTPAAEFGNSADSGLPDPPEPPARGN